MYKIRVDQQEALSRDLPLSLTLAFVCVLAFLMIYFRGFVAPAIVVAPLVIGTIWAFGFAGVVFASLNVLTAFCGAILMGLGVDYGIHVLSRYREARSTRRPVEALAHTYATTGKASLFAGLTTLIGFGSLSATSFRAFFEFGILSVGGLGLILLAYAVVLPCLLFLVADTRFEPRARHRADPKTGCWLQRRGIFRTVSTMLALISWLILAAAFGIGNVHYDYRVSSIQLNELESVRLDEKVKEIVDLSRYPAVMLVESDAHAQRVAAELRRRMTEMPEGDSVARVMTADDLLPSDQDEKRRILTDLTRTLDGLPKKVLRKNDELADFQTEIDRLAERGEAEFDELPQSMSAPFQRRDDSAKAVVLAFPSFGINDVRHLQRFAKVVRDLPEADGEAGGVDGVNQMLLLADIYELVETDAPRMLLLALLGLFAIAYLAFREVSAVVVAAGTLAMSIFVALGLMGVFGIAFNFINILILPIWLGLGVDAAFHLMMRRREAPSDGAGYLETSRAVAAGFITSTIGFGAMLTTAHNGLYSLGAAAVIGLSAILVMSMLIQALLFVGGWLGAED